MGDPRRGKAWRRLRRDVLAGATECAYCHRPLTEATGREVDHVQPVRTHPELALWRPNLVAACRACNRRKGSGPPPLGLGQQSEVW